MLSSAQRAAILFLAAPPEERGESRDNFCATIGITTRTLDRWKAENREFMQSLDKARKAYDSSPDFYALCVRRKALALINDGLAMPIGTKKGELSSSERRQYIDAALRETKQVSDTMDTIDRTHLSDAELVAEFLARGIGVELPALIECCDILTKGEPCSSSSPEPVSLSELPTSALEPVVAKAKRKYKKRKPSANPKPKGRGAVKVPPKAST